MSRLRPLPLSLPSQSPVHTIGGKFKQDKHNEGSVFSFVQCSAVQYVQLIRGLEPYSTVWYRGEWSTVRQGKTGLEKERGRELRFKRP